MKAELGVPWMCTPSFHRRGRSSLAVPQRLIVVLSLLLCSMGEPALAADAKCKLGEMARFPVTMNGLRPMVNAKINGTDVRFTLDSGAFYSMITPASAAALKLHTYPAPPGFLVTGIGGAIRVDLTKADNFDLNGMSLHDVGFIVGGNDESGESVGLLGRNLIQIADTEFDLAQGVVRLMTPTDCDDTVLAYWAQSGDSYSAVNIEKASVSLFASGKARTVARYVEPITATALVNGVKIWVIFDTGAPTSFLTVKAAAKAGIKVDSPGVISAGYSGGIGRVPVATYLAPVESFKIGEEEVRNTRLRLGDTTISGADMLIGADFFLSHHIYVANSQHKLYFTYNGGPVFNLKTVAAAATQPAPAAQAAQTATRDPKDAEDASDNARRGAAFAARQDFDQALTALTRACELVPDNPDYFYQRGTVFWQSNQPEKALNDFDRALHLKPSYVLALLARSDLRIQAGDRMGAVADLNAANAAAPREDAAHYSMAADYVRLGRFTQAIEQYDLWIASHPVDAKLYSALVGRCRVRALGDISLQSALEDCNQALSHARKASPFYAEVLDTRGLVWLRLGDYDKSTADFDASLKITPRNAWSLYGRGIDKMRAKKTSDGQADIAQAKLISADIGDTFDKYGIVP
jgi:tetratricopeptide (TPR) repeat protein/predicted aspartyl protease